MPVVYNKRRNDPPGAIYVGRGSPWGNPFVIGQHGTRAQVIERFRCEILPTLDVSKLRGRDLVCFCKPLACHADLLLAKAADLNP